MNETSFIRSVHRHLPKDVYRWKINARFVDGIPDAWYCGSEGGHLWVEYKYIALPKRATTLVIADLSQAQHDWLVDRGQQGIPTAVVVGSEIGGVWFDNATAAKEGIPQDEYLAKALPARGLACQIAERVNRRPENNSRRPRKRREVEANLADQENRS